MHIASMQEHSKTTDSTTKTVTSTATVSPKVALALMNRKDKDKFANLQVNMNAGSISGAHDSASATVKLKQMDLASAQQNRVALASRLQSHVRGLARTAAGEESSENSSEEEEKFKKKPRPRRKPREAGKTGPSFSFLHQWKKWNNGKKREFLVGRFISK